MRAEAREQARVDLFDERLQPTAQEEIDYLLHNESGRDPDIFALLGADPEITIDEYEAIPVVDRDTNWVIGVSAMTRACTLQVWASQQDDLVNIFEQRVKSLGNVKLSKTELKVAAMDGILKADIAEEKEAMSNGN